MTLPQSLLSTVEAHSCFSGTFSYSNEGHIVLDPARPPERILSIHCDDCLMWHTGALCSLLPTGMRAHALASEASKHVAAARGYDAVIGGYHGSPANFWLSAAYLDSIGVFLLDGRRSRGVGSDLDLLVQSFKQKVWVPKDPAMTDPSNYNTQTIHVTMADAHGPWPSLQAFLSSPAVHAAAGAQTHAVTLAVFQRAATTVAPVSAALAPPAPTSVASAAVVHPSDAKLVEGAVCAKCGETVGWRTLLTSHYLGCGC